MQTVFLDQDSMDRGDIDYSGLDHSVPGWRAYAHTEPSQVLKRIRDADIVITNKVILDHAILSAAHALKLVCVAATGTNNVDLHAAYQHNIAVSNARAYATASVVEHVFTLLTSLVRYLDDYRQASVDGRWMHSQQFCFIDKPIIELAGKTMGIIGYGELGRAVASVARAFNMKVVIGQRPGSDKTEPGRMAIDEMLPQVDVLSLHCPLADNTRNLIDKRSFELMPGHAVLINTARGGIVNETDLLHALQTGQIAAAGLDVLHEEPPVHGNVLLDRAIPNLIVTPHVAWASREARQRLLGEIVENIVAFQSGAVRNRVEG
jgi:glycerate dehydrogenase